MDIKERTIIAGLWDMFDEEYNGQDNTKVRRQTNMYYSEIHILTDADVDGTGSIAPGLLNFFWRWPDLFRNGRIKIVRTPIIIANKGTSKSQDVWFYDLPSWHENTTKYNKVRYIKGLGSLSENEYKTCIDTSPRYIISVNSPSDFDLLYLKGNIGNTNNTWENKRRNWLLS